MWTRGLAGALCAVMALVGGLAGADTAGKKKDEASFGAIRTAEVAEARKEAEAWLKSVGKTDAATLEKFAAIWASDRPTIDKVAETICLGDADAAKMLATARDENSPAPTTLPALLKDTKKSAFYRSNLALAYAKALTQRKVFEEALEAFVVTKADEVVDPSAFLFHKAVCEHSLMMKDRADGSIDRLLVDVSESPERYRMVASMMHFDMLTWAEKDLGWIARKMDNIQRRLDLQRGGKNTQKMQKEVLVRLDEMIKDLENKQDGKCDCNGGSCPDGGTPKDGDGQPNQVGKPLQETKLHQMGGTGEVEKKRYKEIADVWGKLPEKDRERIRQEMRDKMSSKDRAMLDAYIREMQARTASKK